MLLTFFVIIAGLLVGLARGGQLTNALGVQVYWWPLIVVGVGFQVLVDQFDIPAPVSVFVIGSFLLIVGLGRNLHIKGAGIAMVGTALNLLVVVANGHIPTRLEALIGAGKIDATIDPAQVLGIGTLGELETSDTVFARLGDIVPVPILNDVISFGDLILLAGLFVIAMNLVLEKRRAGVDLDDILGEPAVVDLRSDIDLSDAEPSANGRTEAETAQAVATTDPADLDRITG